MASEDSAEQKTSNWQVCASTCYHTNKTYESKTANRVAAGTLLYGIEMLDATGRQLLQIHGEITNGAKVEKPQNANFAYLPLNSEQGAQLVVRFVSWEATGFDWHEAYYTNNKARELPPMQP